MKGFSRFLGLASWILIGIGVGLFSFSAVNLMWFGLIISVTMILLAFIFINIRNEVDREDMENEAIENEVTEVFEVIPGNRNDNNLGKYVSSFSANGVPALTSTTIKESVDSKGIICPGAYAIVHPDGSYVVGVDPKNVHLGIVKNVTSLHDKIYYMKRSLFMDFIELDELERWMEYIMQTGKITNVHNSIHANKNEFKKSELGRIIEFRNIVNDYFEKG